MILLNSFNRAKSISVDFLEISMQKIKLKTFSLTHP